MQIRILAAAVLGVALVAGAAAAHEGHDHKVMGTVAAVDAKHIEVTGIHGHKTSIELTPETKYLHGEMAAQLSSVSVGQRVVVVFRQHEKANLAKEVRLGVKASGAATAPGASRSLP